MTGSGVKKGSFRRWLFTSPEHVERRAYLWNFASSITFSFQSALFLLIATRAGGETEAGAFIILFTTAQMLNAIGNFSVRSFQVSDLKGEYSFSTYYTTRCITCFAMVLAAAGYCLQKGTDYVDTIVMGCLVGYRLIECIEDVSHGMLQRMGRFDVSSICMTARITASSIAFCVVFALTGSRLWASVSLLAVSAVIYAVLIAEVRREYPAELARRPEFRQIHRLLFACAPLFIGAFLYSYLINAPKYAIDALLTPKDQTVYNILFAPVFVINMLSLFIYRPLTVRITEKWINAPLRDFLKITGQILLMIAGVTVLVLIGGELIGLRLLEIIYGVTLESRREMFLWLLVFGGVTSVFCFVELLLTVMRKQFFTLVSYSIGFVFHLIFTRRLILARGIEGAGFAYGVIVLAILVTDTCGFAWFLCRRRRREKNNEV